MQMFHVDQDGNFHKLTAQQELDVVLSKVPPEGIVRLEQSQMDSKWNLKVAFEEDRRKNDGSYGFVNIGAAVKHPSGTWHPCDGVHNALEFSTKKEAVQFLILEEFKARKYGPKVYWNDPDDGIGSGIYRIFEKHDDGETVTLTNEEGISEIGAYVHELAPAKVEPEN